MQGFVAELCQPNHSFIPKHHRDVAAIQSTGWDFKKNTDRAY